MSAPQPRPIEDPTQTGDPERLAADLETAARAAALSALTATRASEPETAAPAAPATTASWRGSWTALTITALARAVLAALAGLLLWSLLPAVIGWHSTVVMSGSMEPRLHVGDVVVSRPVAANKLRVGQVVLADDPDHHGRLRLHRIAAFRSDGTLTLRGDANRQNDSSPVARSAVHGVGSLRVPYIGAPAYWLRTGQLPQAVLTAAALAALIAAAFLYRADDDPSEDGADEDETHQDGASGADAPARTPGAHRAEPAPDTTVMHRRAARFAVAGVLALGVGGGMLATAGPAGAATKFSGATSNPANSWKAATYFTCANAAVGDGARFAWPLSESSGLLGATDITGNSFTGAYSATGVTYGVAGPCNGKTGVTLNGTSGNVSLANPASNIPDLSLEVWFKASGTHGGSLMSITNGTTTTMALAMTTTGTVVLGVSSGGVKTVSTTAAFNDNQWHLAVGVVGSGGMALYVDNRAAVTNTGVTSASAVTGTPRVGYADASDLGTGTNDYFQGSVAYASLYKLSLTATQVASHYYAA